MLNLKNIQTGAIKIGLPPLVGASFFPKIIGDFHQIYPSIEIQLVEEGGKTIEKALLEGSIDVACVVLPVNKELFEIAPLVKRELVLIVNSSHPLAESKQVKFKDLQSESFILYSKDYSLHDRVIEVCAKNGFKPKVAHESANWLFISEMVVANLGISLLPETICHKLDPTKITTIRLTDTRVEWNLAIIWRKNQYLSYAAKEWIQFVKDTFEDKEDGIQAIKP